MVGFDFAPLVFFNEDIDALEVDMSLVHDVKEQSYGTGKKEYYASYAYSNIALDTTHNHNEPS